MERCAITFCILGNIWKKQVAKMDFLDFLIAISCRFGVRGPLLERVPVHAPQYRGHTLVLKNDYTSFQKNRKSVTKAQKLQLNLPPKHPKRNLLFTYVS